MLTNTAAFPAADPDTNNVIAATTGTHIILLTYVFTRDCSYLPKSQQIDTRVKPLRNGFDFIYLDRIYRIDGIFFAFGEEPFRPKAVLSR